jgi:hypothetical protein
LTSSRSLLASVIGAPGRQPGERDEGQAPPARLKIDSI